MPLSERRGLDAVVSYFTRSAPLYFFAHSMRGAMHMALNPDGNFHRRGYQAQSLIVERHIRRQGARRVLEIGCGRGFNLLSLARRNSDVGFVGVDLTPLHVRAARAVARRRRNLEIHEGDFHRLPYADESFDLVFSVEAICHAADVYQVVEEVRRVLRAGGRFVTIEPWRRPGFEALGEAARDVVRLVETVFVLPNLQEFDRWLERTTTLGFEPILSEDVTAAALPNLEKLRRQALRWRRISWGRAAVQRLAPQLMENALAAILMGECFRDGPSTAPGCYRVTVVERA
ncbi:MAG: arsenite methyltransferase [Gaiellaceae bacterium]|nr:arsenite methyltransferase [Gaiellaceae bacterium]